MQIIQVASEVYPFAKTGGLADVVGSLPKALSRKGHFVPVFLPLYRQVLDKSYDLDQTGISVSVPMGDEIQRGGIVRGVIPGTDIPVFFIQNDQYYDREGLYGTTKGDYQENSARFVFFTRAVLEAITKLGLKPDIIHSHDWQTALLPIYMRTVYAMREEILKAKSVLTIHNLSYQGIFWHWDMRLAGLDWSLFNWKGLEFWGKMNFLKGGAIFADAITTVSPGYAKEIQTPEFGCGLEGVLKERGTSLHGILNGCDYNIWNPEIDELIHARYSASNLSGKEACKKYLRKKLGLRTKGAGPLIGIIGRLIDQKGIDIVIEAFRDIIAMKAQLAILGTGEERYQEALANLASGFKGMASVTVGFNNKLAHEIEAGADMFLMPSRFEPCGLSQLYSLKYGTVPIVRSTGGLQDTVEDSATGFSFGEMSKENMLSAIGRATQMFKDKEAWQRLMINGMKKDWSWDRSASEYERLYENIVAV